ncbi:TIGR02302 family protein [Agaricicola taiwanensis]|uniref:TIGR02302 family protein n=1 Tax=Agaricicola taiwanensis TaxID=591372 RepID=A0A8J3DYX8_9RHOB|nr:TIGR02302 family protein [Agaricicola taiwanensis]GGE51146.1 TIGR02302 family protein [Agaricicola taiwanensis]
MSQSPSHKAASQRTYALDGLIARARAVILWEAAWPRLALAGSILLLFIALSWFSLWQSLAPMGRIIGVALFALAFLYAAAPLLRLVRPSDARALARIDHASGHDHRPATALADHLATGEDDALTRAFWDMHRRKAEASAGRLTTGLPAPGLTARDPLALRFALLLAVIVGFFIAGDERGARIASAFDWKGATVAAVPPRLDAWVTPPPYTGRPPIYLTAGTESTSEGSASLRVPAGSVVVARVSGGAVDVATDGGLEPGKTPPADANPDGVREWSFKLTGDGTLTVDPEAGAAREWQFTALPDRAPEIAFAEPPGAGPRGQTVLSYRITDDYGATAGEAKIAALEADAEANPLVEAPKVPLVLPQRRAQDRTAVTTTDLQEHPWAGARVSITLEARDAAGNLGRSSAMEMTLPQRNFRDPLARSLVEQRRNLALDINARKRVERALDSLALYPERFTPKASTYLALRSVYWRLKQAEGTEDLRGAVDYLWQIAIRLEDGEMSEIERDLKAARDALREALERGASEEEIRKLTQDLRQAMEKFLAEMARRAQTAEQMPPGAMPPNAQMVRPQDLRDMLDRLEEFAQKGANQAAQDMLSQLDQILEGLNPNATAQMDPMSEEMARMLDQLGEMIRKQNELRDRTFQEGQQGEQGQPGQEGQQQGQNGMEGLQQDQQALQQQLQELMKQLQQQGINGGQELGQAGEEMGAAGEQLGQGDAPGAVGPQGRALEALRRGAQGLTQQMMGEGNEPGQGNQPGGPGTNRQTGQRANDQNVDPLGRPTRTRRYDPGSSVRVPGEIDAQRARQVLEELRRRLSDPERPQLELDYLERLIEP